jgi:ABC-type glycerol-3-phosphate transport system substrate-binding protein
MTYKQFDASVRTSARMEEFELTEHMKNRLRETIANPAAGKKIKRFTARTVLTAVLIVLLLSAVAYAAATNPTILEIYTSWFGEDSDAVKTLNGQTVQTPELSFELNDIVIRVTQAIYDGNTLYTTGTVSAKETSNVVIMADGYVPKDPANADFHRSKEDFSKAPTYKEAAEQNGAKLLRTGVWVEAEGGDGSYMIENIPLADGTYSFVSEFPGVKVTGDKINCTITALQHEVTGDGIEIPDTRVLKDWTFTVPAIAKEIRTPVPTPVVTPVSHDVQEQALIVVGDSPNGKPARFFKAAYPDSPVVYREGLYDENGMYHITDAILKGTVEWDVMYVNTSQTNLTLLIESGCLKDLNGYPQLMGKVSAMQPNIRDALMKDGKLYAFPQRIDNRGYSCGSPYADVDIWTASGYTEKDIPQTLDELLDFIGKWLDRPAAEREKAIISMAGAEGSYRAWLLDMLLDKYIDSYDYAGKQLDFDTELFTRLLKRIDEVSARLEKEERPGQGKQILFCDTTNLIESVSRITPLRLSQDLPYLAASNMFVYIINPQSRHMEQAVDYVRCGLIETDDSQRIMMYEGLTLLDLPNTHYDDELQIRDESVTHWQEQLGSAKTDNDREKAKESLDRALARRQKAEANVFATSADDLSAYQNNIAPHLFFPKQKFFDKSTEAWKAMDTLKKNYLANKISDEEFVKALNGLASEPEAK